jgi:hypothetical protein
MSVVLLNALGTPEPSPEIQRRLRGVHPKLHLKYMTGGGRHWALCMDWSDDDHRRERIQRREVDPEKAYDIVGFLPMDCNVEQAPAYLERALRTYPKEEIQRMADDVVNFNATAPMAAAAEAALADVLDSADPTGLVRKRGRPRKIV